MSVNRPATVAVRWYLLALAVGVAIVGGFWLNARAAVYPILPDSTAYLEMARSFVHHGRFEVAPWSLTEPGVAAAPTALWPPLYPLTIAALSQLGVNDVLAAPLINRCCFALLPALLLWALAGTTSPQRIIVAGALALTTPGVLAAQYFGLSEGLAALLIVIAVGCVLRTDRWVMLLLSGLCSGAAYVTRNPALAVCAAIPLWLLFDAPTFADAPRRLVPWGAGALAAIAPLWGYNLQVFGRVQPYAAEASNTGVLRNMRMLTVSVAGDLLGARGADRWLSALVPSAIAVLVLLVVALWAWRARPARELGGRAARLLVIVAAAMASLLVAAASRYQFQGLNEHRFVVPFLWTIFAAGAIAFPARAAGDSRRLLAGVVLVLLIGARGYDSWQRVRHRTDHVDGAIAVAGDTALRGHVLAGATPPPFVVSNAAWVLRAEVGSATRQLLFCPDYAGQLTRLNAIAAERLVEVIITSRVNGDLCETQWAESLKSAGFTAAFTSPQSVVYRKDPSVSPDRS